ncbi:hypothetical protein TWF694_003541 [Orbilia ellipsospora]|uniref:Carrier domain-containing protein n=1 Tax=Orbilia ellipsospora TaxID=2528407 RepID=A0AAV9X0Z2_9PEZI
MVAVTGTLLPKAFEERAEKNSQGIFAVIPKSPSSYAAGFREMKNVEVQNAINSVAWSIEKSFGRGVDFETIAYLGPNDPRYFIVLLAGIKVGYKIFLPSPRNSIVAHVSLLTELKCKKLICTDPQVPCIPIILESYPMQKLHIPSLQELLDQRAVPNYPYDTTYEKEKLNPFCVLHTSGSTGKPTRSLFHTYGFNELPTTLGIPKPRIWTHEFVSRVFNTNILPPPKEFRDPCNYLKGRFFAGLPAFHAAGVVFCFILPPLCEMIPVYPPPAAPPVTSIFVDTVKHVDVDWAFLSPVIVDDLGKDKSLLDLVAPKLDFIIFGGGALPQVHGDIVNPRIPLFAMLGLTETANIPQLKSFTDGFPSDWSYMRFHPSASVEFRHRFDDFYELVVVRKPEYEHHQAIFALFPDKNEYETKDLYSPHPTRSGLWQHKTRIDDIIVFLNGEKTNPVSFEDEMGRHPEISAALVAGHQRFEASLLVELVDKKELTSQERKEVIDRIWPSIFQANRTCPTHAKVSKDMVLILDPARPMVRAGKGTVQRQATLNLYAKELDLLYNKPDPQPTSPKRVKRSNGMNNRTLVSDIRTMVEMVTEWRKFKDSDDFFALGMDSLQVLQLLKELKLQLSIPALSVSTVYANPSVDLLAQEILKSSNPTNGHTTPASDRKNNLVQIRQRYETFIDGFERGIRAFRQQLSPPEPTESKVVLLTGSTGALGSHILQTLLLDTNVGHIYCFNRSLDSKDTQIRKNIERQLPTEFDTSRVTFIASDLSKPSFGLAQSVYNKIISSVTHVIHNAWPVDFNRALQSFQSSLDGVLNLVCFATLARRHPAILFLSSISSAMNYGKTSGAAAFVPETVLTDDDSPAPMGYGESKYLAERMLDYATKKLDLVTGTVRITQITGPAVVGSGWNRNEWFPSLVISSRFIGALPESLGVKNTRYPAGSLGQIDWIPVDQLAGIIKELSFFLGEQTYGSNIRVFHTMNPKVTTWEDLLPSARNILQNSLSKSQQGAEKKDIEIVPFSEWIERIRDAGSFESIAKDEGGNSELFYQKPALKLLEFYESLLESEEGNTKVDFEIKETLQVCDAMRDLEAIKPEWMAKWVEGWMSS